MNFERLRIRERARRAYCVDATSISRKRARAKRDAGVRVGSVRNASFTRHSNSELARRPLEPMRSSGVERESVRDRGVGAALVVFWCWCSRRSVWNRP